MARRGAVVGERDLSVSGGAPLRQLKESNRAGLDVGRIRQDVCTLLAVCAFLVTCSIACAFYKLAALRFRLRWRWLLALWEICLQRATGWRSSPVLWACWRGGISGNTIARDRQRASHSIEFIGLWSASGENFITSEALTGAVPGFFEGTDRDAILVDGNRNEIYRRSPVREPAARP